jgi:hypothetical protein
MLSNEKQSHEYNHTVFIDKTINSGIMRMYIYFFIIFIFIYSILLVKCYVFSQMIVVGLVWEIFFFILVILFLFYLIIWWGIGIASESELEVLKDGWFGSHNFFYYFLLFCLNILATSYIWGNNSHSWIDVGKTLNLGLALAFPLTPVFVWRWTHIWGHWIISSMTRMLKIVLWMFQKMCISEFDILFVIYFYLFM